MGQPTQRATNYTARSNIDTAQIFLHANGQRPKRAMIRQRSRRRQRRGEPHTEHGLGVLLAHSGIDEKRPTEKFVTSARPPTWVWEVVRTVAAPPSIVIKCGGGVVLRVVVCGVVIVISCVV